MTTRILVLTSGQPARVIAETRGPGGKFEQHLVVECPANTFREVWVPDGGQLIVEEPKPESLVAERLPHQPEAET